MPPRKPDTPHPNAIAFSQSKWGTSWEPEMGNLPLFAQLKNRLVVPSYGAPLDTRPSGARQIIDDYSALGNVCDALLLQHLMNHDGESSDEEDQV